MAVGSRAGLYKQPLQPPLVNAEGQRNPSPDARIKEGSGMGTEELRTEMVRLERTHCLGPQIQHPPPPQKATPQSPAQLLVCLREGLALLGRTGSG